MISIVMSTRQRDQAYIDKAIKTSGLKNVQFLCYENNGELSLTQVYNKGLADSTNDIVIFMHDDLDLETGSNWGKKIINHFENSHFGILGKAGCTELPETAMWWGNPNHMVGRVHHEMIHPQNGKKVKWLSEYSGSFNEIIPVVVVDGLFFAVHKQRVKQKFDETIKGFHLYDVDYCIANVLESVAVGVIFSFPVSHKSIGQTDEQWEENRKQIASKYAGKLPLVAPTKLIVNTNTVKIKKEPKVSIVIPTKGNTEMVKNLTESIRLKSNYKNLEIIIADTGSEPEDILELNRIVANTNRGTNNVVTKLVRYDYYNFAKINNDVVKNHVSTDTDLILFSNNDVVLVNDCISLMVDTYLKHRHTCGTVGARLHFENDMIQHAGVFIRQQKEANLPFVAGHVGYNTPYQYSNRTYSVVGSTAAFLLIAKVLFDKIGGFNEQYVGCFEDVELNLQVLLRKHQNYICGEAVAYHLESQTRQPGVKPEDLQRLNVFIRDHYEKLVKYIIQPT